MKWIYKFMEVYIWITLAVLMLLACEQHIVAGNTLTAFVLLGVGVIFLYIFKREKSKG